jgi:hypothetical protein
MKRAALVGLGVLALLAFIGWLIWSARPPLGEGTTEQQEAAPRLPTVRVPHAEPLPQRVEEPAGVPVASAVTETNAADFYRKAFALYDALSGEEKKALGDWKAEIGDAAVARLCEKVEPILDQMHEAAALTNCDWGLGPLTVETASRFLPIPDQSRALARTATWSADHCHSEDASGAVDDVLASLQIGHHASQAGLIGFMVSTAIQGLAMGYIAGNASKFGGPDSERLIRVLNYPQYEEDFYRAIEQEAELASRADSNLAGYNELARQLAELEREYAAVLTKPEAEYQAWLSRMQAAQASNPYVKTLRWGIENAMDQARAAVVQRAMVSAGLTVVQGGKDALPTYPDPATGKAFLYQETADGFELQSVYQFQGQPVTMTFRRQDSGEH